MMMMLVTNCVMKCVVGRSLCLELCGGDDDGGHQLCDEMCCWSLPLRGVMW